MKTFHLSPLLKKILIGVGILLLGILATCVVIETARSRKASADSLTAQQNFEAEYAKIVSQKTNAYELVQTGLRQSEINLPAFALISSTRATEIKTDYRDAWLALGLAQFRQSDFPAALTSFQKAEKLDPIYAQTYEFLRFAYEAVEDQASAQKAAEKYAFLTKK